MRREVFISGIIFFVLSFTLLNTVEAAIKILPTPLSDRTFQYVRIEETFKGSPLKVKALVPNVIVVIGQGEDAELLKQAIAISYMLGQWTDDPGSSIEKIKTGKTLAPVLTDKEINEDIYTDYNLIVVGLNNSIYERFKTRLKGSGSFIEVLKDAFIKGKDIMFVSDAKAAFYLANRRLYFKAGAYSGYFSFIKARLLIEKGNLDAALDLIKDPNAIKGCGKPIMLAIGFKEKLPEGLLKVAKKRNRLIFKELSQALIQGNKTLAAELWHKAMLTCYACHQGADKTPRFRKFIPNRGEHSYHHVIVKRFNASCNVCHYGKTVFRGYKY